MYIFNKILISSIKIKIFTIITIGNIRLLCNNIYLFYKKYNIKGKLWYLLN